MEEVVAADEAGRNRRPAAKVGRRRRAGGIPPEVAADDIRAREAEEEDLDEMNRAWFPQMLCSAFLMLAKARHYFTHPPAWLSRAREAGTGGGEHHHHQLLAAARLYESLSALALVLEAAILMALCLFQLELVSAGRARAALRRFMAASFVTCLAAFTVTISMVGSEEAAAVFLMALPNAPAAVQFALEMLKRVLGKVE